MVIFHSYISLPEGNHPPSSGQKPQKSTEKRIGHATAGGVEGGTRARVRGDAEM